MTPEDLKEDLVLVWGFQREEPCFEFFRKQLDIVLEAYHQANVDSEKQCNIDSVVVPKGTLCEHPFDKVLQTNNNINYCSKCDKAI